MEATDATDATWTIRSVFKAAWEKQEGAKAKILLAGILYLLISFIVETCFGAILVATGLPEFDQQGTWHNLLMGLLVNLLMAPLLYGFWLLGINRSAGISINIKSIFEPLTLFLTLVGLNFLILFLTLMGTLLLIIPGIYLGISYALAPVLVIKKEHGYLGLNGDFSKNGDEILVEVFWFWATAYTFEFSWSDSICRPANLDCTCESYSVWRSLQFLFPSR